MAKGKLTSSKDKAIEVKNQSYQRIGTDNGKYKHGMYNSKIYKVFTTMRARCNNPNNNRFYRYGGRGIRCEWNSFEEFYKDMGEDYKEGLTIDRINNNGNYCKENCRWVNYKEQSRNTSKNIEYKGKCAKDWCIELGINYSTVTTRLWRGKTLQEALGLN